MESVAETIVMPGETLEDLQVPSEQLVKVDGRTKAAKNK
jgi:hypothetical protein